MYNFESVNSVKPRKYNKWQLFWILFALNILGFATARFYFHAQQDHTKANTEAVDFNNKYGASVNGANTLFGWGLELLHLLRDRK
ncbi:MAG: hypothetical protein KG003_09030 [Bacteroidetes bacterium]|nr:hypothetical protein [Bacteroidota bacterium]